MPNTVFQWGATNFPSLLSHFLRFKVWTFTQPHAAFSMQGEIVSLDSDSLSPALRTCCLKTSSDLNMQGSPISSSPLREHCHQTGTSSDIWVQEEGILVCIKNIKQTNFQQQSRRNASHNLLCYFEFMYFCSKIVLMQYGTPLCRYNNPLACAGCVCSSFSTRSNFQIMVFTV